MAHARCSLNDEIVRANTRVWSAAGGGRIRPVLKSNGYGWGALRLARLLEDLVEGFCVVDAFEFRELNAQTEHPLTLLGFCRADEIEEMLTADALPNIATLDELDAACRFAQAQQRTSRLRVGLSPSLGWNGVTPEQAGAFAERAAACAFIELELWTHLTSPQAQARELADFDAFVDTFRRASARIASVETASSSSLAAGVGAREGPLRIGIGIFGAYTTVFPTLHCALQLEADVISRQAATSDLVAGYARTSLPPGAFVEILRIGYGDGLPRGLAGTTLQLPEGAVRIATIGMQHTIITHDLDAAPLRTLLHPASDITALCAGSGTSAHELVVTLGLAHAC